MRLGPQDSLEGRATVVHSLPTVWRLQGTKTKPAIQRQDVTFLRRILQWLNVAKANIRSLGTKTDIEMGTTTTIPTIRITKPSTANSIRSQPSIRSLSIEQVDGPSAYGTARTSHSMTPNPTPIDKDADRSSLGHGTAKTSQQAMTMNGRIRQSSSSWVEDDILGGDTVRRRESSHSTMIWQANSSETSRATATQFVMPAHGFRTPAWADQLFGGARTSETTTTPFSSCESSGC